MEFALLQAVFLPLLLSPVAYILGRKYEQTLQCGLLLAFCCIVL